MTRKEQIELASKIDSDGVDRNVVNWFFVRGAEWADNNPITQSCPHPFDKIIKNFSDGFECNDCKMKMEPIAFREILTE